MIRARALPLLLAALLAAPIARADDASGKRHFKTGVDLYDAKDYGKALGEFRAAYADLRSYVVKRNIALCLRALGKNAEAIDALEEYLAEGGDKIDAPLRESAEATITEMNAKVATVRVSVDPPSAQLFVDDAPIAPTRRAMPLRLDPGTHALRAHAEGRADATQSVTVAAGQRDVPVSLATGAQGDPTRGTLRVRANVATADITVDGAPAQRGAWIGQLSPGVHRVAVIAPGYARVDESVRVVADQTQDVPVSLAPLAVPPPPPPLHEAPAAPPPLPKEKLWFGLAGISFQGETLPSGAALDDQQGTKHSFNGGAVTVQLGRMLGRHFALVGDFELGTFGTTSFGSPNDPSLPVHINLVDWVLAPEILYKSGGDVQLVAGLGLGLEGNVIDATIAEKSNGVPTQAERKGNAVGGVVLGEIGGELRFRRVFIDALFFVDGHGNNSLKDENDRVFFAEAASGRAGIRVLLGTPLF